MHIPAAGQVFGQALESAISAATIFVARALLGGIVTACTSNQQILVAIVVHDIRARLRFFGILATPHQNQGAQRDQTSRKLFKKSRLIHVFTSK